MIEAVMATNGSNGGPDDNFTTFFSATSTVVALLEEEVGLSPGFLNRLWHEDDWSFVIKAHALLEAAIAHYIADGIRRPGIDDFVAKMPIGGRVSKRELGVVLGVLTNQQGTFVDAISKIRNRLAHNPRNAGLTLSDYVANLGQQERSQLASALNGILATRGNTDFTANLKAGAFVGFMVILADMYLRRSMREPARAALEALNRAAANLAPGSNL
jgi:hypothetical protein